MRKYKLVERFYVVYDDVGYSEERTREVIPTGRWKLSGDDSLYLEVSRVQKKTFWFKKNVEETLMYWVHWSNLEILKDEIIFECEKGES